MIHTGPLKFNLQGYRNIKTEFYLCLSCRAEESDAMCRLFEAINHPILAQIGVVQLRVKAVIVRIIVRKSVLYIKIFFHFLFFF